MRAKFQKCIIGTLFEATNMKKVFALLLAALLLLPLPGRAGRGGADSSPGGGTK